MRFLTEKARLNCKHGGEVRNAAGQDWVRVSGDSVLTEPDPEGRDIDRCPNRGPQGIKPCDKTLKVRHGYSTFIRIDGKPVCLDDLWGLTDGTPPGVVKYVVVRPGQDYVSGAA